MMDLTYLFDWTGDPPNRTIEYLSTLLNLAVKGYPNFRDFPQFIRIGNIKFGKFPKNFMMIQ